MSGNGFEPQLGEMRYRWVILVVAWLTYVSFGLVLYSFAPLVSPVQRDLSLSYAQAGVILGSWQFVYIFTAIPIGLATDKIGPRRMIGIGAAIITLSCFLRAVASSFEIMLLAVALFGFGGPAVSIGIPKVVSIWFTGKEKSIAQGIGQTAPNATAFVILSTMNSMLVPWMHSWRSIFLFLTTVSFIIFILWWIVSREAIQKRGMNESSLPLLKGLSAIIKVRNAMVIPVVGIAYFMLTHGVSNWLPTIIEQTGVMATQAGVMAAIPPAVSVPASVIIPRVFSKRRRTVAALLLILGSFTSFAIGTFSGTMLDVVLVLQGICIGSISPTLVLILQETPAIGSKLMGIAAGLYYSIGEVGGFLGPSLVGYYRGLYSFQVGLSAVTIVCVIALVPLLTLTRPDPQAQRCIP